MNIIFFGSSAFGLSSLQALLDKGHNISCVVTQPDRRKGRGMRLAETPVKDFAVRHKISIYQPREINTSEAVNFLNKFNPDIFVVAAYGQILSKQILNIPRLMPINIHGSLLPFYRGAAPINRAIINGETKTGITIIKMTEQMDAGPIILQEEIAINEKDTFTEIEAGLSELAGDLIITSIDLIERNECLLIPQDKNKVSFAPKLKKDDGLINWKKNAKDIYNLIRGCIVWPGAFTYYKGKILKILEAKYSVSVNTTVGLAPGQIADVSKDGITVITGEGYLIIKRLQIEGKRQMTVPEFIAGHKIQIGEFVGGARDIL